MELTIRTQDQLVKSLETLTRLKHAVQQPLQHIVSTTFLDGLLQGRLQQYLIDHGELTSRQAQDILHQLQGNVAFRGGNAGTNAYFNAYFARLSENLEQAFDIAVNDKPLPENLGPKAEQKHIR